MLEVGDVKEKEFGKIEKILWEKGKEERMDR